MKKTTDISETKDQNMEKYDITGPIGVFDSGVGGISVLSELVKLMPNEDFIYFGDSANAPYGAKTEEEIRELTIKNVEHLLSQGAKGICVACNTATSAAVRLMRGMFPELPLVGLEPAVKPAVLSKDHPKVLVMATQATVRQEKLKHLLQKYGDLGTVITLGCPGIVELVEQGITEGPEVEQVIEGLLHDYIKKDIDCVVLGCTHFPFVKKTISKVMGEDVAIFDGGGGAARQMKRLLDEKGLLRNEPDRTGRIRFENSLSTVEEIHLCRLLLENGG